MNPVTFGEILLVVAPLLVKQWERWTKPKRRTTRRKKRRS